MERTRCNQAPIPAKRWVELRSRDAGIAGLPFLPGPHRPVALAIISVILMRAGVVQGGRRTTILLP
jgi:hypothetical protein